MGTPGKPDGHAYSLSRRRLFAASCVAPSLIGRAWADEAYPSRAVRLILPFAPGGATDLTGRLVANAMSRQSGQQFVVDNRGGAGGDIAMLATINAPPDGYTIVLGGDAWSVRGPILRRDLPYDPDAGLVPVARWVIPWTVLVIPADLPAQSFPEFVRYLRERPGAASFGSSGPGTMSHVIADLFTKELGLEAVHVPYRGSSLALQDLGAGRLQYFFPTAGGLLPVLRGPKFRILAVTSRERQAVLPGIPTIEELGMPTLAMNTWYGCFAPARTPRSIVARLSELAGAALADPEVSTPLLEQAVIPAFLADQEFADFIAQQKARWRQLAEQFSLQM